MSDDCSHPCGGACCRRFPLNRSPAQLGARYVELTAWRDSGGEMEPWMLESMMICEMVISLADEGDETPTYTCKHFDDATGRCTAYDRRPKMCSEYPSYGEPGRSCTHCGFTQTPATPELVQLKVAS